VTLYPAALGGAPGHFWTGAAGLTALALTCRLEPTDEAPLPASGQFLALGGSHNSSIEAAHPRWVGGLLLASPLIVLRPARHARPTPLFRSILFHAHIPA
jgi:hypothetical protein